MLIALTRFVDQFGNCYPSLTKVAEVAGLRRNNIPASMSKLEARGYIRRKRVGTKITSYSIEFGTADEGPAVMSGNDREQVPLSCPEMTGVIPPHDSAVMPGDAPGVMPGDDVSSPIEHPNGTAQEIAHSAIDVSFEEWWRQFPPGPRKVNKPKAASAYRRIIRQRKATADELLRGVMAYGASKDVADGFACMPVTYLNQERWKADYSAQQGRRQGGGLFEAFADIARGFDNAK